jgi:hypothetical protein
MRRERAKEKNRKEERNFAAKEGMIPKEKGQHLMQFVQVSAQKSRQVQQISRRFPRVRRAQKSRPYSSK